MAEGERAAVRQLPRGTVALLMGDVEGSTSLWERDPATARRAMERIEAIGARLAEEHGGAMPLEQGEGDNVIIAFERASAAIEAAVELQRRVGVAAEVKVRLAVHAGEVELRDERRYMGPTMNRAARLRDAAHGGQVLVSAAAAELAEAAGLPAGAELVDLGLHVLRGVPEPQRIYQLLHRDLPFVFPPLRTGGRDGVLPVPRTSFVGRAEELAELASLVRTRRVVSVLGAAGSGKTRIATELATSFLERGWRVRFVPLADRQADGVVPAVAAALHVRLSPGRSLGAAAAGQLGNERVLVVLDNAEHVADATAAAVDELLEAPGVTVLVTTREQLRVEGEVAWRLPPLDEADAVDLFRDRAALVLPQDAAEKLDRGVVAEVCDTLDRLPLAIELGAARLPAMSLAELRGAVADRFSVLDCGPRNASPRQRTLHASVEWSHDLLTEAERIALRRVSVFVGSFDAEAATWVIGFDRDHDPAARELLASLVAKSLVVAERDEEHARFRLLETIRAYAAEKLEASGEEDRAREAHLGFYAERFVRPMFMGAGRGEVLARLARDLDNVRAATAWAARKGDVVVGLQLAAPAFIAWWMAGRLDEGAQALTALLEAAPEAPPGLRAWALWGRGTLSHLLSPQAMDDLRAALELARACGERMVESGAMATLGLMAARTGQADQARELTDDALAIARETGDEFLLAYALFTVGFAATCRADRAAAATVLEEGVEIARSAGFPIHLHAILLAQARLALGDLDDAERLLAEGMPAARSSGDTTWILNGEMVTFRTALNRGRFDDAEAVLGRLAALSSPELQRFVDHARSEGLATLRFHQGRHEEAMEAARAATDAAERASAPQADLAATWLLRSRICAEVGLRDEADQALARAIELGEPSGHAGLHLALRLARGDAAIERGDPGEAASELNAALAVLRPTEPLAALAVIAYAARVRNAQSRPAEAARLLAAYDANRRATGLAPPPHFRVDVTPEKLAVELGPRFEELWAEGEHMTIGDAVDYARRATGPRRRAVAGWESLTPMERATAELAAEGLTNREIALRLFISARTVGTHLQHVYGKLHVRSRTELARQVVERAAAR